MFRAYDTRINKHLENDNQHSQTEMGLVLHCSLWVLLFFACCHLYHRQFFYFCFLYICIYEPDMFRQIFFPVAIGF